MSASDDAHVYYAVANIKYRHITCQLALAIFCETAKEQFLQLRYLSDIWFQLRDLHFIVVCTPSDAIYSVSDSQDRYVSDSPSTRLTPKLSAHLHAAFLTFAIDSRSHQCNPDPLSSHAST